MWNFDKQDKMQLLAKFKKIIYMGFRATLNFRQMRNKKKIHCAVKGDAFREAYIS